MLALVARYLEPTTLLRLALALSHTHLGDVQHQVAQVRADGDHR